MAKKTTCNLMVRSKWNIENYQKKSSVVIGMGFSFLESVYEKCLFIELEKESLRAELQIPIPVYCDNHVILSKIE